MNRKVTCCLAIGAAMLVSGSALLAHHAESAQFDVNQPVEMTGVVKKVEWANPHIWYYVEVKDETGKTTVWGFSGGPPGMLARRGFTKDTLKPGMVVTVRGSRAKDGSNNASGGRVTFPDGRQVFANSAEIGLGGAPRP
jgi:DNA/RNA endonuclease YhcR with UshA esterase domain